MPKIYLIHAAADRELASFLKRDIERLIPGASVFMASQPGAIPTGKDWRSEVSQQLRAAEMFVTLLTPTSIERQWVWFESGVAWQSERRTLPVAAAGLERGDIPDPVGALQALDLEDPENAQQFFRELGGAPGDVSAFCATVRKLGRQGADASRDGGWRGIESVGRFFAWDGPLHRLQDRNAAAASPELHEALKAHGMTPRAPMSFLNPRKSVKSAFSCIRLTSVC